MVCEHIKDTQKKLTFKSNPIEILINKKVWMTSKDGTAKIN